MVIQEAHELWSLLPHPSDSHVVRVFARDRKTGRTRGDYVRSARELDLWLQMNCLVDCYIAPNPTVQTGGERHTAQDVTHWSYLLVDVDPTGENPRPDVAMHEALGWLTEWTGKNLMGALVIDSGRGRQAWIRLDDVPMLDEGITRKIARKTMGYWLRLLDERLQQTYETHGCRVDTSTSDLPRLMRAPGSVNYKTGKTARIVHPSEKTYPGLAQLLVAGVPAHVFVEPIITPSGKGLTWQGAFPFLTRTAQTYLTEGQEEPGRHRVLWHTARCLAEQGVTLDEARNALTWANSILGQDNALSSEDIEHALRTAFPS